MEFLNELKKIRREIVEEFEGYQEELKEYDLQLTDITHAIEFANFDVVKGYHLAKMLKDVTIERRKVKDKHNELMNLKHKTDPLDQIISDIQKYRENKERTYKFRTKKFKKMFGEKIDVDFKIPTLKEDEVKEAKTNKFINSIAKSFGIK